MQASMLRRAVERLAANEAFAAWHVHAALGATHHVLCNAAGRRRGVLGAARELSFVRLEYPVRDGKAEHQQEEFQSPIPA